MPHSKSKISFKYYSNLDSKGISAIFLIPLVFIVFAGSLMLMIYFLKDQIGFPKITVQTVEQQIKKQLGRTPLIPADPAEKDWQEFNISAINTTVKYPPDWQSTDDHSFAQFPNPIKYSSKAISNTVSVINHVGVLYEGYYDQDLFEKLYNLNKDDSFSPDYFNQNATKIYTIAKGNIQSGQRYVLTQTQKNDQSEDNLNCYILNSGTLTILSLTGYDDFGVETFKKIIETTQIN